MTTRAEHLQWAKDRALALVDSGDLQDAFNSMISDLGKHPELQYHTARTMLGPMLLVGGHLKTAHAMREFITGFN